MLAAQKTQQLRRGQPASFWIRRSLTKTIAKILRLAKVSADKSLIMAKRLLYSAVSPE